jgi:predicted O-linked N-acetylglucosamine transferase (SPINDLY family)
VSAFALRKLRQAQELLQRGDATTARRLCEEVLQRAPRNPEALCLLGIAQLAAGDAARALPLLEQAASSQAGYGLALEHLGLANLMLGRFADAERALRSAAALPAAPPSVHMRLGVSLLQQGREREALSPLQAAVRAAPGDPDCHLNLAHAYAQAGELEAAQEQLNAVLKLDPGHVEARFNLGVLALQRDELDAAQRWFEAVLERSPRYVDALINLGVVLQRKSRLDDAEACLRKAIALEPANAAAGSNLARTLALQGRPEPARKQYLATLQAAPGFTAAHEGLASVCLALGRTGEAIGHLRAAAEAEPGNSGVLSALAHALFEAGQLDESEKAALNALESDPSIAATYATLANLYIVQGQLDRAISILEAGYAKTGAGTLLGTLTHQLRQVCDWTKWRTAWEDLARRIPTESALVSPFWLLCEPTTAEQQLAYTQRWAKSRFRSVMTRPHGTAIGRRQQSRFRVGYLSSDLQDHAAAYLIAEVLELHDRDRFEVFAYSYGPEDQGAMRRRLRAACEHFIDIGREPDDVASERIRNDALDVLVDLKGYTAGDRLSIMAHRPCDVQVTWLGYPGTTGAAFVDYLIADAFIIPPERESAYSERIVRLPHCYQPNDRKRPAAEPAPRAAYGLPDHAFVFCCFNQTYKITPDLFAAWMRLLETVPASVLWLVDSNRWAKRNLLEAAQAQGIAAERLVFAARLPYASHLARYRVADLALDTFPYTSHTTLSDALWCGCPTVALCGETFASRVSGSLLKAADMPELVTHNLRDYEELARRLATDRALFAQARSKATAAKSSPLFDPESLTRDLERLYLQMRQS